MCIFCQIIKGQAPADIVYEDEKVMAFKNTRPKANIHLLIVPKRHIESVDKLQEKDKQITGQMLLAAKKIAKENGLDRKGYQLLFNGGSFAVVPHLHVHLIGEKVVEDE